MKGVFVVLSGVADEPCQALGQITPLQAAKTPNLDALSSGGRIDHCFSVKEGIIPQSSSAIVSLLGYDPNGVARGALEAKGMGIELTRGDLVMRANFATIEDLKSKNIMDRRAGRTLTEKEIGLLTKSINERVKLGFNFEFHPTMHHRGVLVFRGGFSDNISGVDPAYAGGFTVKDGRASKKLKLSNAMDDEDDSKLAADLVNKFVRESHRILDEHNLNLHRAKKGLYSANCLLLRDIGNEPVKLRKLRGKWMAFAASPLGKGVAESVKMDVWKTSYPKMKNMDVYSNLHSGLKKSIKNCVKMLKRRSKKYDYFFIHINETDVPGHDSKPLDKVRMIEELDKGLFGYLKKVVDKQGAKLIVTSDHVTSSRLKSHSSGAVPVLHYDSLNKIEEEETRRFTEEEGLKGKKFKGRDLLEQTLFSK